MMTAAVSTYRLPPNTSRTQRKSFKTSQLGLELASPASQRSAWFCEKTDIIFHTELPCPSCENISSRSVCKCGAHIQQNFMEMPMQLVPEDHEYDLTDDLEPGWQVMVVLKHWTKEVDTKNPPGSTTTYLVVEFGSADKEVADTVEWSGPLRQKGTRSKMGRLMKALFPEQQVVKSLSELVGKQCEVNLQENENGFLQVAEVRSIKEHTQTKKRSK